jgi:hypothetical protein
MWNKWIGWETWTGHVAWMELDRGGAKGMVHRGLEPGVCRGRAHKTEKMSNQGSTSSGTNVGTDLGFVDPGESDPEGAGTGSGSGDDPEYKLSETEEEELRGNGGGR